jgi:hypothetical protein
VAPTGGRVAGVRTRSPVDEKPKAGPAAFSNLRSTQALRSAVAALALRARELVIACRVRGQLSVRNRSGSLRSLRLVWSYQTVRRSMLTRGPCCWVTHTSIPIARGDRPMSCQSIIIPW